MFRTVLFGASNLSHTEPGTDAATPALLRNLITAAAPAFEHEVIASPLQYGERMAERVRTVIEREAADAAFVQLGTYSMEQDFIVYAIRRRWPALFPVAMRLAVRLNKLSGVGLDGGRGARGSLYRVPKAMVRQITGADPRLPIESVVAWGKETIDVLARFEDKVTAVNLVPSIWQTRQLPIAAQRIALIDGELRRHCAKRRVPFLSRPDYVREMGVVPEPSPGSMYPGRATRDADARAMARLVLEATGAGKAPSAP